MNAINDIFPDINAPHTQHIYMPTGTYKKFIVQPADIPRTRPEADTHSRYTDTKRTKCMIYNAQGKFIYAGIFRRTIDIDGDELRITLHRADRQVQVYPYVPIDGKCGYTVEELRKHGIEFYHI